MRRPESKAKLAVSPGFVFRTPRLPLTDLLRWNEGRHTDLDADADEATLAESLRHDRALLRSRLREVFSQQEFRDAVFVASSALDEGLDVWMRDPIGADAHKVERALVRYYTRMASRATPFGLFSGVSTGQVGESTELELVPRSAYTRHTRLDNEYVFALAQGLASDPTLRAELRYRPNSSAYAAAGRVHYAESNGGTGARSYSLVAVDETPYLIATLGRAHAGATRRDLAAALVTDDPDIEVDEAETFVDELVDTEMLVPEFGPAVTGPTPIDRLRTQLRTLTAKPAHEAAAALDHAADRIASLDAAAAPSRDVYQSITDGLAALPAPADVGRLFQVDLFKPTTHATLGRDVVAEVEHGVAHLTRISQHQRPLAEFSDAFIARYGEREVPLVEALDDEVGIGFDGPNGRGDASPLLAGLAFPPGSGEGGTAWGGREQLLLTRLKAVWGSGARQLRLDDGDLNRLAVDQPAQLPDAFSVSTQIAATSPQALARGDFHVLLESGGGPSGARLSGRFCHLDPHLRLGVQEHLRAEQALQPEAVFAEVAYLPEGRLGNVACRPVLRDYEIVYMGRSGAPPERQIPLSDLMLSVRAGRLVLRSRRLDKEVIPRCSTAHNYATHGFGAYRFLCTLQSQDGDFFGFDWGPFADAPFLPRVLHGRLVLAVARWRIGPEDLQEIARAGDDRGRAGSSLEAADRQFVAVQNLRRVRGLPRHVLVADGDRELHVDLDNALCVDSFVHLVRRRTTCLLKEVYPAPEELCVSGPEGRFRAELSLSFTSKRAASSSRVTKARSPSPRRFAPGSAWTYAKLYTGAATADEVLRRIVGPLSRQALAAEVADQWFFVRYHDTDNHLRVRFRGDANTMHQTLAPMTAGAWQSGLDANLIWRVQLDTYEREVERYGGPEGIECAERIAHHDSNTVLSLLDRVGGEGGLDARWRLALVGTDMLMADLGLDLAARHEVVLRARAGLGAEFSVDEGFAKQLAAKFRRERADLTALIEGSDTDHPLAPGLAILRRRSVMLAPVVAELHDHARAGRLTLPVGEIAWTYVHMHVNRLLRSSHRAQELVMYDLLRRLYASSLARGRQSARLHAGVA